MTPTDEKLEMMLTEDEADYALGVMRSHHKGLCELRMGIPVILKSLLDKLSLHRKGA